MSTEGADFYITGGTLRADAPSYVERAADRELYDALSRSDCCYVLTSRQMGKSSLMVRTAFRLRAEGVRVAVLDLTAIGLNLTPDQWYGGLLRRMARQLDPRRGLEDRVDDYWTEHPELSPLQRFTDALEHVVLPYASATPAPADAPARPALVIFIDEIDVVLSLPFNTDELFAAIRAFYNRRDENPDLRRLTFCFLGVATPSDLIREARMTPFNIGVRVELCDFTPAEALPLRHGLSADPRKGEALLKRVLHWTGGHPYLTQRLCRSFSVEPAGETSDAVDAVCGKLFLAAGAQDRDDNLLFVRERMLHGTDDPAALLTMLMQVRRGARIPARNTDPVVEQLLLSGVVRASRARLEVRNRIYHHVFAPQWITEHMPDAEVRRQRAAYRRGLVRATAFAGSITLVVAALGLYAWDQAGRAERYAQARTQESERAAAESRRATRSEANSKQQTFRANRERSAAVKARAAAVRLAAARERALKYAHGQQLVAEAATGRALGAEQTARNEAATTRRLLYAANAHLLQREWEAGNFARVHQLLADSRDHPDRGFEWAFWERKSHPEEALLVGHTDAVTAAGYSRDGRLLTGSADGSVRLWSPSGSSRLLLTQFVSVTAAAFSPDGSRIVTGGGDGGVRIWDARTGRLLALLPGHTGIVNAIDWSPDGSRLLAASEDASVRIWNRTGGEYRRILSVGNPVRAAVWSRDGRRIVTGTAEGGLAVWNAETGQRLAASPLSPRALGSMVVSASGRTVAAAGAEGVIYLWDLDKQEVLRRMKGHSAAVTSVRLTADGTLLSTSQDRTACIWNAAEGKLIRELRGHAGALLCGAFSPDGKSVVTGDVDGVARRWRVAAASSVPVLERNRSVRGIAFSPDGAILATACADGSLGIWNARSATELRRIRGHDRGAASITFDRTGTRLLSAGADEMARIWRVADGSAMGHVEGHTGDLNSALFSADGVRCVTASWDGTSRLWNLRPQHARGTLSEDGVQVRAARFSADGKRVVTARDDGTATIWSIEEPKPHPLRRLTGHTGELRDAAFSPDGNLVVTAGADGTLQLWPAGGFGAPRVLRGHTGAITAVAFLPRRVVSASLDGTVRLWDLLTGRECLSIDAEVGGLSAVAVSPDGRRIAAGGERGVTFWDAANPTDAEAWARQDDALPDRRARARKELSEFSARSLQTRIPPRQPGTPARLIDLTPHYNALLTESWHDLARLPANDLSELGSGQVSLRGTLFDVRGVVQLQYPARGRDHRDYPRAVNGIRIRQPCRRLVFLHGASGGTSLADVGLRIGTYRIRYADGVTHDVPLSYGIHLRDWWEALPVTGSQIAWEGKNAASRPDRTVRVYKTTWSNPRPQIPIASVDFRFGGVICSPFLLAITAE